MRKPVLLFVMLLLLISLIPSGSGVSIPDAPRTMIAVTTNIDEFGEGSGCGLREAIQTSNTGVDFGGCVMNGSGAIAITIPAGTYSLTLHGSSEDANATGDLDILVPLDLYGAGAGTTIIQGDGDMSENDRVFHVVQDADSDYLVTMWDLSITGGYSVGDGAGILNEESLWVSRVSIYNNDADVNGGGVASEPLHSSQGFHAYLSSSITGNSSNALGGGIVVSEGELRLDHVDVSGNTAMGGAGMFIGGEAATISWANVHANIAINDGGGIMIGDGDLTLEDSSIYANSTGADGGNLYLWTGTGNASITRCYIGGGQAPSGAGAGIYNASGLTLASSTVTLNTGDRAAGIYQATTTQSGLDLTILDSTITRNNLAAPIGSYGNGLYNEQDMSDIEIRNTILAWNGNPGTAMYDNCLSAGNPARLISLGYNLDSGSSCGFSLSSDLPDADPLLGTLDYHGGFSLSYDLSNGSPALESGGACLASDQRGYHRPLDQDWDGVALCDIGAYEAESYALTPMVWFPLARKP